MASNPKVYTDRSNAAKAAKKLGGVRKQVPGGWIVEMPVEEVGVAPEQSASATTPTTERRSDGFWAVIGDRSTGPFVTEKLAAAEGKRIARRGFEKLAARAPKKQQPVEVDDVMREVRVFVPETKAAAVAASLANKAGRAVEILNPVDGVRLSLVEPGAKPARAGKTPRVKGDPTVKPIVTSASNAHLQRMFDKIEEARGDAGALRALNGFKRSSTYYKMAGRYIDALIAEAAA